MGRFGHGGGTPRVVGFDFTPPPAATPWTAAAAPPVGDEPVFDAPVYEPPVYEASVSAPPAYEPPAYEPPVYEVPGYEAPVAAAPAYPPPAYPAPAVPEQAPYAAAYAEPAAAPVATLAPPAYPAPFPAPWETPQAAFPPAPSWTPPQPKRTSPLSGRTLRTAASVVVALGLFAGRVYLRTSGDDSSAVTLRTPATLGAQPRLTSPLAQSLERDAVKALPEIEQPVVGLYGTGSPTYVLIAGAGSGGSAQEALRSFSTGFASNGGTVSAPKQIGGVACSRIAAGAMKGAVCAWSSQPSDGVVMQYVGSDVTALAKVTLRARAEVNGG